MGTFFPFLGSFSSRQIENTINHCGVAEPGARSRPTPLSSFARAGAFDVTRSRQLLHSFKRYVFQSGSFFSETILGPPFSLLPPHRGKTPPPPASRPQRSAAAPLVLRACSFCLLPPRFFRRLSLPCSPPPRPACCTTAHTHTLAGFESVRRVPCAGMPMSSSSSNYLLTITTLPILLLPLYLTLSTSLPSSPPALPILPLLPRISHRPASLVPRSPASPLSRLLP